MISRPRKKSKLYLTTRLLILTDQLKISLSACYLPGRYNSIADRLSREKPLPEWHLLPEATEAVFRKWGEPEIDLFASAETRVVPRYVTLDSRDGLAEFCNAFSRQWKYQLGWIFPPPNIMPQVLRDLNKGLGKFILIAPVWNQCYWMPDLRARALEEHLPIQNLRRVLIDRTTGHHPPQVELLELQAWKIGGGANKYPNWVLKRGNS